MDKRGFSTLKTFKRNVNFLQIYKRKHKSNVNSVSISFRCETVLVKNKKLTGHFYTEAQRFKCFK